MEKNINLDRKSIRTVPSTIGIYIFRNNKKILYIGKSVNLRARLLSHLENSKVDAKEKRIIDSSAKVEYQVTDSEFKALLLEAELIQKYRPKYNVIWKDDKSNLYIKITVKDVYPKIFTSRKENDGSSLYFGPFPSIKVAESILRTIRKVFPYCTQKKISNRACFYSKINLCSPCPNNIEKITDLNLKLKLEGQYKKNIRQIIKILSGKFELVLNSLKKQLESLKNQHNYEEAITLRDKIITFERFLSQQLIFNSEPSINRSKEKINSLQVFLEKFFPDIKQIKRIECYDMSNLSMKEATASMVVFYDGIPAVDQYRKFKIRNLKLTSDIEMMKEIISRRFKNSWSYPDLIIVDGGRPQVLAIIKLLGSSSIRIPLIGIAKNPDRIIIGNANLPTIVFKYNDLGFNLIQQIRDESHRFAKKYHLFLRNKKLLI